MPLKCRATSNPVVFEHSRAGLPAVKEVGAV